MYHNKCGKLLKDGSTRAPFLSSEKPMCRTRSNRTESGTADLFKIGKEVSGCILSPCLFNWYIEHIMQNARMGDSQAEIKIYGRIINNLRYTDDTTLMAEREEELKCLLVGVKEENEKAGLKLSIQKKKFIAAGPIISWQIDVKKVEASDRFYCVGLQNHCIQ